MLLNIIREFGSSRIRNVALFLFSKTIRLGSIFLVSVIIARNYSLNTFAIFCFINSIQSILLVASSFGLEDYSIISFANKDGGEFSQLITCRIFNSILALFSFLFISIWFPMSRNNYWVCICLGLTLLMSFNETFDHYYQGRKQFLKLMILRDGFYLIATLLLFACSREKLSIEIGLSIYAIPIIISTIPPILSKKDIIKFNLGQIISWSSIVNSYKLLWNLSPLFLAFISTMISMRIDQIFLGLNQSKDIVSNYCAGTRVYEMCLFPLMLLGTILFSYLDINKADFRSKFVTRTGVMAIASMSLALIIYLNSSWVSNTIFGAKYVHSSVYLKQTIMAIPLAAISISFQKFMILNRMLISIARRSAFTLIVCITSAEVLTRFFPSQCGYYPVVSQLSTSIGFLLLFPEGRLMLKLATIKAIK